MFYTNIFKINIFFRVLLLRLLRMPGISCLCHVWLLSANVWAQICCHISEHIGALSLMRTVAITGWCSFQTQTANSLSNIMVHAHILYFRKYSKKKICITKLELGCSAERGGYFSHPIPYTIFHLIPQDSSSGLSSAFRTY